MHSFHRHYMPPQMRARHFKTSRSLLYAQPRRGFIQRTTTGVADGRRKLAEFKRRQNNKYRHYTLVSGWEPLSARCRLECVYATPARHGRPLADVYSGGWRPNWVAKVPRGIQVSRNSSELRGEVRNAGDSDTFYVAREDGGACRSAERRMKRQA